jgi:hypothetical protein
MSVLTWLRIAISVALVMLFGLQLYRVFQAKNKHTRLLVIVTLLVVTYSISIGAAAVSFESNPGLQVSFEAIQQFAYLVA